MDEALARRPAGLTGEEVGRHYARVFIGRRCVLGPTLVVPLWIVWKEYESWMARNGKVGRAKDLRSLLDDAPWATVLERPHARGKLKTIVTGLGLRPTAPTSWAPA